MRRREAGGDAESDRSDSRVCPPDPLGGRPDGESAARRERDERVELYCLPYTAWIAAGVRTYDGRQTTVVRR